MCPTGLGARGERLDRGVIHHVSAGPRRASEDQGGPDQGARREPKGAASLFPTFLAARAGRDRYDVDCGSACGALRAAHDLLAKYNSEIRAIVALPEMREQLASQGLVPNTGSPSSSRGSEGGFRENGQGDP